MKVKIELEINVPNTVYCGDCFHAKDKDARFPYCDIFMSALNKAKDRPQLVKCEKCLLAMRKGA